MGKYRVETDNGTYEVETDEPSSAGPGRGGHMPPGAPAAIAPDPSTLSPMGRFAGGVDQVLNLGGNRPNQKMKGLHNAFVGGSELAAPLAIPALAAAPLATAGAMALGAGGNLVGNGVARAMGASPEVADLAGDAASIPGAAFGGKAGGRLDMIPRANWMDAAETMPYGIGTTVRAAEKLFTPHGPTVSPWQGPLPAPGFEPPVPRPESNRGMPPWASGPGPSSTVVPEFGPVRAQLPSGRTPGGIQNQQMPSAPSPRSAPLWSSGPGVSPNTPESFSPIPSNLSSGRTPGGIFNQQPTKTAGRPAIAPAPVTESAVPDYGPITQQYKPSRTKARFDASGKRIGG